MSEAFAGWRGRVAYALLLLVVLLAGLGRPPLFDVDEGAFSEATREMVASGDYGHTTLNGDDRFDKPIGVYWLQAASVGVFGVEPFAFRLPSALSGWVMALALAAFAARRLGPGVGALVGVITVSSLGWSAILRAATADGLLNLLIVLAALDLWRFAESGERAPVRRAYAWVGLGLLVKGPVAALVPGAAFILWALSSRRWDRLWQAATDLWGWVTLLVIAAPWYAYAWHRHGMDFVDGFLLRHNLERFSGPMEGHGGSLAYYIAALPLLAMPWAPLLAVVAARVRSLWAEPLARYLLVWGVFVLVFFSLSGTKLPHYVLYGYAPLALLAARVAVEAGPRLRAVLWTVLVLWTACLAWLPWEAQAVARTLGDPFLAGLIAASPAPQPWGPALVAAGWMLLGGLGLRLWHQRRSGGRVTAASPTPLTALLDRAQQPIVRLAAGALVLALFVGLWVAPWWGEALQGPVQRVAAAARAEAQRTGQPLHAVRLVQFRLHMPSVAVYLEQPVPRRDPQPGDWVFTRVDRLTPAEEARPVIFQERGLLLLGPLP